MTTTTIGVIGGSGFYQMPALERIEQIEIDTPFGKPSDPFLRGRIGDVPIYGAGLFAGKHGAIAATGTGERIIENSLARHAHELLARGAHARDVAHDGARRRRRSPHGVGRTQVGRIEVRRSLRRIR